MRALRLKKKSKVNESRVLLVYLGRGENEKTPGDNTSLRILSSVSLFKHLANHSKFSGEIIQIHIGQAGIQIANACWEHYCVEHGIRSDGCICCFPTDYSFETFFSLTNTLKVVPRVVMVDTEPTVIDEIRTGAYRWLFHPDTLISGKEDAGSNFARGYYTLGSELIDYVMDVLRRTAEACKNLRGFLVFRSIGGGTGSGLGNLIMERIQSDFGRLPKLEFIIFPSPSMSPLIVEPYNAILSTHMSMDISDCSFIIDNDALYDICAQNLKVNSPTYTNLNRIIGQVVSAFTASQRFTGSSNVSFQEFETNLVPYPRIHFPLVSYAPLMNKTNHSYGSLSTENMTQLCFHPWSQLVRCNPASGKCMACVLLYRGDVSPADVHRGIGNLKTKNTTRFVDWAPTGFKVGINSMPPAFIPGGDLAPTNRSVVALTNSTSIEKAWCRLIRKYNQLISRRAFVHHFIGEGLEEHNLREASENVCTLVHDYQKISSVDRISLAEDVPITLGSK